MKQTSKARIKRILEKHCVMVQAEFYTPVQDGFGDITERKKYGQYPLYLSQLLHRYNPYIELRTDDDNTYHRRRTPMGVMPYDEPLDIKVGDRVIISGKEYTITFCEDVKGYYYLLSFITNE